MKISHGYDEAKWWYGIFITKEEWKRKTQWLKLKHHTKEYHDALMECYSGLMNNYWSLNRLCNTDSFSFTSSQRKCWELYVEYIHAKKYNQSLLDNGDMICTMTLENMVKKQPEYI
jgi:hypothetical protein